MGLKNGTSRLGRRRRRHRLLQTRGPAPKSSASLPPRERRRRVTPLTQPARAGKRRPPAPSTVSATQVFPPRCARESPNSHRSSPHGYTRNTSETAPPARHPTEIPRSPSSHYSLPSKPHQTNDLQFTLDK